ncbi:hypothetical protein THAOC_20726 [Thalassiosira oceanica]|uniref:Uncharacterized protein n=1 Tax=Thalassiosira oceanica TaxID=159749 RepID=K0S1F7_THAOC|nr:hypothetical protein THAOC_20726 [Thalassiosira oceanica]|eukprot:EJK59095.1 hypothetical protein THAOC_20726 [Thalassiosira oceanica]
MLKCQFRVTRLSLHELIGCETAAYLARKQARLVNDNDMIKALLDPRRWTQPEIPTRQLAFLMLRNCLQFRGDYWLRHLPPQMTEAFAKALDESTMGFFEHAIGDTLSRWTDLGMRRLEMPVRCNGGGFRSCDRRQAVQYVGNLAHGAPQLLDRADTDGNVIPGRMHIPALIQHFGEDSFNTPNTAPWAHILENSTDGIATGLRQASSQITKIFEDVAIDGMYDPAKCLALQDVTRIGFHHDGTRPASVTHALTQQVETMEHRWWQREVRNMPTSRYDRWAFECCDKISQQVVLAAPNAMGHMNNEEFVLAITRYFGQQNFPGLWRGSIPW